MGKSKNKNRKRDPSAAAEKTAAKKRAIRKKLLLFGGGALLLAAVILAVFFPLRASGFFLRRKTVAETPHYRIDGAMYSYYFYSSFYDELAGDNAEVYRRNGIDETTNLQKAVYGDGKSWFEFLESVSSSRLQSILQYAEEAADEGVSLSEEGRGELEETVGELREKATAASLSFDRYLAGRFGVGVKEKDVRGFLEVYLLAGEMAEQAKEDLTVSGEEIDRLRQDREFTLAASKTSFFYYVCKAKGGASASEKDKKQARTDAERLLSITDPQSFVNEVRRLEENLASQTGEDLTSELFEEIQADFSYLRVPYSTAVVIDEKIDTRKARETVLFAEEKTGSYGVLLIIEPLHIDEEPSYNYRKVTFSDAADAAAVVNALGGSSVQTADGAAGHCAQGPEQFLTLALDGGGRDGGDIENGAAADAEDDALAAWLREEDRQPGDLFLRTSRDCAVWYFEGTGASAFERAARNRILSEKYAEIDEEIAEKYGNVTVNADSGKAVAKRRSAA